MSFKDSEVDRTLSEIQELFRGAMNAMMLLQNRIGFLEAQLTTGGGSTILNNVPEVNDVDIPVGTGYDAIDLNDPYNVASDGSWAPIGKNEQKPRVLEDWEH